MIMNRMRNGMKIAAIKAPRYGEERRWLLEDLSIVTGATLISKDSPIKLSGVKLEHLGSVKRIEIAKGRTTLADGDVDSERLENKIESLKNMVETVEDMRDAQAIQDRITRLSSAVAAIRLGGATEIEVTEKKHRVEDALEAVRSAQEDGIVPGGGTALLRAAMSVTLQPENEDQMRGAQALLESCYAPITQILNNADISSDLVINTLTQGFDEDSKNIGFNARTEKFEDLVESGVIDPAKTVKCALQNAASAAGTLLTTNCAVLRKGGE